MEGRERQKKSCSVSVGHLIWASWSSFKCWNVLWIYVRAYFMSRDIINTQRLSDYYFITDRRLNYSYSHANVYIMAAKNGARPDRGKRFQKLKRNEKNMCGNSDGGESGANTAAAATAKRILWCFYDMLRHRYAPSCLALRRPPPLSPPAWPHNFRLWCWRYYG